MCTWLFKYHPIIIVYNLLFSDDLSFNKLAEQLHTFTGSYGLYTANNAVDRNTRTCTRTQTIGRNSVFNTVWWKVDLGRLYNIYSIDIIFKSYENYGTRICHYRVAESTPFLSIISCFKVYKEYIGWQKILIS